MTEERAVEAAEAEVSTEAAATTPEQTTEAAPEPDKAPEAGAQPQETASDADGEKPVEDVKPERKRRRMSMQERLGQVTRRAKQAEEELRALREKVQKPPREEDFQSIDDFEIARTKFAFQGIRAEETEAAAKKAQEEARQAQQEAFQAAMMDLYDDVSDYAAQQPDPAKTRDLIQNAPVSDGLMGILAEEPDAPAILEYLGMNAREARGLDSLPPVKLGMEIARIRSVVHSQPRVGRSKTPPPIAPATASGGPVDRDPAKMSQAEYNAFRRQQLGG